MLDERSPEKAKASRGRIDVVTFDVGSTLIRPRPAVERLFWERARARGHSVTLEAVSSFMQDVDQFYEARHAQNPGMWRSQESARGIWIEMYEHLAERVGLAEDAERLAEDVYEAYRRPCHWERYEDVTETLDALRGRGVRMAVVSDWGKELEGILEGMGLSRYFDVVSVSAEVGLSKPDPDLWRLTLDRLGADASTALHVGDRPELDGDGAAGAGMCAVVIDRAGRHGKCAYPTIARLTDLVPMVEGTRD